MPAGGNEAGVRARERKRENLRDEDKGVRERERDRAASVPNSEVHTARFPGWGGKGCKREGDGDSVEEWVCVRERELCHHRERERQSPCTKPHDFLAGGGRGASGRAMETVLKSGCV